MIEEKDNKQRSAEIAADVSEKYKGLDKYCKDKENFDNVIQELYLFEIVLRQINQIFIDTIYSKEIDILTIAADRATNILADTFAKEFMKQTVEEDQLASLPDLNLIVEWIHEIHTNVARQLFLEEFIEEVMEPAYLNIANAIVEISEEDLASSEDAPDAPDAPDTPDTKIEGSTDGN